MKRAFSNESDAQLVIYRAALLDIERLLADASKLIPAESELNHYVNNARMIASCVHQMEGVK